jgi:hypothetical protein
LEHMEHVTTSGGVGVGEGFFQTDSHATAGIAYESIRSQMMNDNYFSQ